mmetsp:Transcript_8887/g.19243  ORF Transcript_8887/g.19243 Transcript_8887/m.19243 type:complete len:201 (+) Transcript_8887:1876-2478(+)
MVLLLLERAVLSIVLDQANKAAARDDGQNIILEPQHRLDRADLSAGMHLTHRHKLRRVLAAGLDLVEAEVTEDGRACKRGEHLARRREAQVLEGDVLVLEGELGGGVLPRGVVQRLAQLELPRRREREVLSEGPPRAARDGCLVTACKVLSAHERLVGSQVPHGEVAVGQAEHQLPLRRPGSEGRVKVGVALQHRVLEQL